MDCVIDAARINDDGCECSEDRVKYVPEQDCNFCTATEVGCGVCEDLARYRKLFANLEAVLIKCEPEHIRLNRYAGTVCAGIKDSSKPGSPIFRFKGVTVLDALEQLAAGVE